MKDLFGKEIPEYFLIASEFQNMGSTVAYKVMNRATKAVAWVLVDLLKVQATRDESYPITIKFLNCKGKPTTHTNVGAHSSIHIQGEDSCIKSHLDNYFKCRT